jgi:hypothetical protein
MILEYKQLIEIQDLLNKLSKPYQGFVDGWGTFGE